MNAAEILEVLRRDGQGEGLELFAGPQDPALVVPRERLHSVCRHLRRSPDLCFEQCVLVTGTHFTAQAGKDGGGRAEGFEVVLHLRSLRHHALLAVKVRLPAADPRLPTVSDLWPAADWHERETYDLLGIGFEGHPNLKRILLPDDWEGHPLRKDYVFPRAYHGISLEVDPPWPTP